MALEVELQAFDGPLDLLLALIEKNKINIFDIPIVEITDQYLAYVRELKEEDLEIMSEFTVMASELLAIKSRMLLPKEEEEDEEEDPREELVRRLLEYKMYTYMSFELRDMMEDACRRFYKDDTTPPEVLKYRPPVDVAELTAGITMEKLHGIFSQVIKRQAEKIDPLRSGFGTIEREEVSLPDKLESVVKYASRHRVFSFRELLTKQKTRMQIVVTFLAVLELMSSGMLKASQENGENDITFEKIGDTLPEELPDEENL